MSCKPSTEFLCLFFCFVGNSEWVTFQYCSVEKRVAVTIDEVHSNALGSSTLPKQRNLSIKHVAKKTFFCLQLRETRVRVRSYYFISGVRRKFPRGASFVTIL